MILLPFVGFNSQAAVEREYFNAHKTFSIYVSNSLILVFVSGGIILLITIVFREALFYYIDFPAEYLWLIPVYCICHSCCEIMLSVWRLHNKATSYGLFRIGRTLLEVAGSIYLVTVFADGWFGRIEGMLAAAIIFAMLSFFFLRKDRMFILKWNNDYQKDIIKILLLLKY